MQLPFPFCVHQCTQNLWTADRHNEQSNDYPLLLKTLSLPGRSNAYRPELDKLSRTLICNHDTGAT